MFREKIPWLVSCLTIITFVISACGPRQAAPAGETAAPPTSVEEHEHEYETVELEPVALGTGEKLQAVATTNILADITSQVGGNAIELTPLLPLGADPHAYTATPQDVVAVTGAHVIFANGANLEADFLPDLVQSTQAPVIYVSQGVELRELETDGTDEHEHGNGGVDPHTWTTPANVTVFVRNIEHALSALDPANANTYESNAQKYVAELEALEEWVAEQIASIPDENRRLVTDHQLFGYYADRYGLEQVGAIIPGFSTASEPSARELAALEDTIREYGVPAIFIGTTVNPSLARQVAADTGIKLVTLYTGSLGPEGSGIETYIDYIRYNTTAIVEGLGKK